MKAKLFVIGFFLLALAACNQPDDGRVETRRATSRSNQVPEPSVPELVEGVEGPSPELSAIDSLMWRQPDSAFARLQQFAASPKAGSLDKYNGHYCQLLISELLYKNDYAQSNRPALRQAVAYFDSLTLLPPFKGVPEGRGIKETLPNRNDRITFLTARAHYINGVGYYENDSLVEACAEYIKGLEIMENHFKEKELVETKAKFMAYSYNRLGDLFEDQFMMDPAIDCYKHSYDYSVISPISIYSISNALYRIGKQYNMKGDKDSADYFYSQALENMPDTTNLYYRDVVSTKSLLSYQLTHQAEASLSRLKQMVVMAEDDDEKLTRYLLIGDIYFEELRFDSARIFLDPVFMNKDDAISQIQAAEYLRILYDSLNEKEKSDYYVHFLAANKPMEYESDAKVSSLSELYKSHLEKNQKQQSEKEKQEERKRAIKKTIFIIIPILFFVVFILFLFVRNKHRKNILAKEEFHQQQLEAKDANARKRMEEREKKHAEAMEAERQAHRMEQTAMSGRLKRSNQEVRELKDQIKQMDDMTAKTELVTSFTDEPICRLIMERVHDGQFKSKIDCELYKSYALNKQQMLELRVAVDRHYHQFSLRLKKAYPKLTNVDIDYCCLYLLRLTYADVSALMQRAYNTVVERSSKIQKVFGGDKPLHVILMEIAQNSSSN